MAHTYVFEAPNTCGILYDETASVVGPYIEGVVGAEVGAPDNYTQFFQFETKQECLDKAIYLDNSYSKNKIFGAISIDLVDTSPEQVDGYVNQQVIFFCECASPESGVTLSYQWIDPQGNFIPTATSSVFQFTPSSKAYSGYYTCRVIASGDYNWTGKRDYQILLKLSEPLAF